MDECDSMSTPMATARLDANLQGTPTNQTKYHSMIRGLMYLTATRPDIAFATFDFGFELIAYSDADHVGCQDDCKSTSGGLQFLGEKLVSWSSKSKIVLRYLLLELSMYRYPLAVHNAIAIYCNPVHHSRTKHIDIRYYFIKEHVKRGTVELYFVGIEYQLADLFTKALQKERFEYIGHRIEFIMAQQQQQQRDVPQDQLCPPNKRFDPMDANKKFDLVNPQSASASVPWIYMHQFWHTLKMDGSKYKFKFFLDTKDLMMTVADFRRIFKLPQATDINNAGFVDAPTFSLMVPFFRNVLGFSLTLRSPSDNYLFRGNYIK
ncbi:hypothetical protein Tco_0236760 [Tanacetum coccineum]